LKLLVMIRMVATKSMSKKTSRTIFSTKVASSE
jgi:hypothetical protein